MTYLTHMYTVIAQYYCNYTVHEVYRVELHIFWGSYIKGFEHFKQYFMIRCAGG